MSLDVCLQDHFRSIVKPAYTNVYRERGGVLGVVEFDTREDLERAIRKLDDTEFKNPFDRAYIRVIDESDDRANRSRSRSPRGRSDLCMFAVIIGISVTVSLQELLLLQAYIPIGFCEGPVNYTATC